jgi:hypothetical protein
MKEKSMKLSTFTLAATALLMFSVNVRSESHKKHEHHSHSQHKSKKSKKTLDAHVHGSASLKLALESIHHLVFEMEIPGMDVVGFEHKAKTKKELAAVEEAKKKIQEGLKGALGLPEPCQIVKSQVRVDEHTDSHSEWEVEGEAHCEGGIKNQKVQIDFSKLFPKIKDIKVQYISDTKQNSFSLKKGQGELSFE